MAWFFSRKEPAWPGMSEADFRTRIKRCRWLLRELRGASPQTEAHQEAVAYIRSTLGAHPLLDDLERAILRGERALGRNRP